MRCVDRENHILYKIDRNNPKTLPGNDGNNVPGISYLKPQKKVFGSQAGVTSHLPEALLEQAQLSCVVEQSMVSRHEGVARRLTGYRLSFKAAQPDGLCGCRENNLEITG